MKNNKKKLAPISERHRFIDSWINKGFQTIQVVDRRPQQFTPKVGIISTRDVFCSIDTDNEGPARTIQFEIPKVVLETNQPNIYDNSFKNE